LKPWGDRIQQRDVVSGVRCSKFAVETAGGMESVSIMGIWMQQGDVEGKPNLVTRVYACSGGMVGFVRQPTVEGFVDKRHNTYKIG